MIAGAQAETKLPSEYKKCMDAVDLGAFKDAQWASCAAQEIKIQDAILNSEYNKLIRDDWCRFEELSSAAPGSAANYNFCILEETTKQASKLKELNR